MEFHTGHFFHQAFLLFLIMDPLGNIPLFLSILNHLDSRKRRLVILRETFLALLVLVLFLLAGNRVMNWFGISGPSLTIAGGVIMFLIALRMIFPPRDGIFGEFPEGEPFLFPLAVPSLAGPSSLTMVMLLSRRSPELRMENTLAVIASCLGALLVLLSSGILMRWLGKRGLLALERTAGMFLAVLSVETLLSGFRVWMRT